MKIKCKYNRILFLHENVTNGGGEKMFRWLGQNLKERGYDIKFLFMFNNPEIDTTGLDADCIDLAISNSYLSRNFRYFTIGAFKLIWYLKKNNIKYIVSFGTNSFYLIGILKKILGLKILVSERADPQFRRFKWLRKKLFAKSDYCVFQTQGARSFFSYNSDERSFIIPNPVKIPEYRWSDDSAKDIISSVGRIDLAHKRQDLLVRAFSIVHQSYPSLKLKFVGEGPDKERLLSLVSELSLLDSVIFTGQVKDVHLELLESRLFVLTSEFEGIPNALLEAMSLGMPVISTDCSPGGAAFLIGSNKNGILVPRGDYYKIAEAILKILSDKCYRIEKGKQAHQSVLNYSEDLIIKEWEDVVDKLIC